MIVHEIHTKFLTEDTTLRWQDTRRFRVDLHGSWLYVKGLAIHSIDWDK